MSELPEPVAWLVAWQGEKHQYVQTFVSETTAVDKAMMMGGTCEPLFTAEQMAAAVAQDREPLGEGALMGVYIDFDRVADKGWSSAEYLLHFARAVERAHGIGAAPTEPKP